MNELTKRVISSIFMFILILISLVNIYILFLSLCFIFYEIIFEFNRILKKIFFNNNSILYLLLFLILIYTFLIILKIFTILLGNNTENQITLLIILLICVSTDLGGYIFGKLFKGRKLTKVSPNKTYSGMIGSYFLSLVTIFLFFKNNLSIEIIIFITIAISSISQIGDIFISYLKRKANMKDTGKFLPGHGGLLDRIDGIYFALPFGWLILNL